MVRARSAAEKALELDPELGAAHAAMASVRLHADWNFEAAEAQFLRALDLDPGSWITHQQYAVLLAYSLRTPEAIKHLEIAQDLDRLARDPGGTDLGRVYESNGEPERAVAFWKQRESLAPSYVAYVPHGNYLCRQGRYAEAIALLEKAQPSVWATANLAYCHAISGRRDAARSKLLELTTPAQTRYVSPVALALVHTGLGDLDAAFGELERAYALRDLRLLTLRRSPHWQLLADDPRYATLVRRIGFPGS